MSEDDQPAAGRGVHDRGRARISYEVTGSGFPILLLAPGGMHSAASLWSNMPYDPLRELAGAYRLVAMDQRNAGASTATITGDDGWSDYADDQLSLMDHLGIEEFHVLGMCIGGPFTFGLLRAAPERVRSAVALQPVGIDGNRDALHEMFDRWAEAIAAAHPEADDDTWARFRHNLWDGDFVLTATRDQVATVQTPVLLAAGNDHYHPNAISRELARLLPDVTFLERWKDDDALDDTRTAISDFLAGHTPA